MRDHHRFEYIGRPQAVEQRGGTIELQRRLDQYRGDFVAVVGKCLGLKQILDMAGVARGEFLHHGFKLQIDWGHATPVRCYHELIAILAQCIRRHRQTCALKIAPTRGSRTPSSEQTTCSVSGVRLPQYFAPRV